MLPVMGLRFGYAKHEGSSYKLGRLVCKGADLSVTENGRKPQTCADLWRIGHTLDGFYLFHKDDVGQPPSFGVSYCNFKGMSLVLI